MIFHQRYLYLYKYGFHSVTTLQNYYIHHVFVYHHQTTNQTFFLIPFIHQKRVYLNYIETLSKLNKFALNFSFRLNKI